MTTQNLDAIESIATAVAADPVERETPIICEACESGVHADDARIVYTRLDLSEVWCDDCASDDTLVCSCCDRSFAIGGRVTMREVRTSAYEQSLYCEECFDSGDFAFNVDTDEYATSRYANALWHFWDSDDSWHSDEDGEDDESVLHDYSTDVIEEHGWPRVTPKDALCFGVELEFECTRDRYDVSRRLGGRSGDGRYILKSDGSLNYDTGIELVTLPYTLDHHLKQFDWPALLANLHGRARSGQGTDRCGMHVHVNRRALTPLQIGKALVFLNCDDNVRFVRTVAQRASNGYCERDSGKKITHAKYACSRYDLLNIGSEATVEFRLFRGNLRPERVLKNLEFCHALLTYCKDASMREVENYRAFVAWLAARAHTYPNLIRYLRDFGYLPTRTIPAAYAVQVADIADA